MRHNLPNLVKHETETHAEDAVYLIALYDVWEYKLWRHQMETFSALLAICAGNSPVPGEFSTQSPVTRSFNVFFDLRLNKRLSKNWWGWWFETLSRPLWRQRNVVKTRRLHDGLIFIMKIIIPRKNVLISRQGPGRRSVRSRDMP